MVAVRAQHFRLIKIRLSAVPAEPRVMLFATEVMKAKPLYCNGLAIYKIVELGQKSAEKGI